MPKDSEYETNIIRIALNGANKMAGSTNTNMTFQVNVPYQIEDGQIFLEDCIMVNVEHDSDSVGDGLFKDIYEVNFHCNLAYQPLSFDSRTGGPLDLLKCVPLTPRNCYGATGETVGIFNQAFQQPASIATTTDYTSAVGVLQTWAAGAPVNVNGEAIGQPKVEYMDLYYTNSNLSVGVPIKGIDLNGLMINIRITDQSDGELDSTLLDAAKLTILILDRKIKR